MENQGIETTNQRKIEIYQRAIRSIEIQISNKKFGLILDSGTRHPEIVNEEKIAELEE